MLACSSLLDSSLDSPQLCLYRWSRYTLQRLHHPLSGVSSLVNTVRDKTIIQ